ncbi:helix-turn-helix transcriptional regulator [Clostridium felsineum]|uniref:helix-turn-helix transcriptional regulator n=1 Tax=Clostridium felsineum TaxID=36839 RepID=UPI00098CD9C8|nr:helix-turn-helix transcriptional regulator [Clostridium felsineum]URZ04058.1 hypothetical protein CLAUR_041240 [Clostridium felsineum]
MEGFEILSVGDKLKNLRKKYNLSQDDIVGNEITRNLISQIEHNKANLTVSVANVILKNLKLISKKNKIDIDINLDYLLENEKSQAIKILDKYIKELKDLSIYKDAIFTSKLFEAEEFLVNWDLKDKKLAIFELAGDFFCNTNDLYNSSIYYEKAKALISTTKPNHHIISILRKLSTVYFYMGRYEDDIKCCDFALNQFKNMKEDYQYIFVYNSALCYMKLNKFDIALKRFVSIEKQLKKVHTDKYYEVILQKAVCLHELKEYDKSLKLLYKILEIVGKDNYKKYIIILLNICDVYISIDNFDKVREILNSIVEYKSHLDENFLYLPEIYFEIGKIYKEINLIEKAEEYFLGALKYTKNTIRFHLEPDILCELVNIYISSNHKDKIYDIMNEFFILSAKNNKPNNSIKNKLIDYFLDINDIQALRQIHNFTKKFQ